MKKFLLPMAALSLMSFSAYASDTENADALIEIQTALSIDHVQDLDFGTVNPDSPAGTVAPGDGDAAVFEVSGEANTAYNITLPTSINMVHGGGTGDPIEVNSFISDPPVGTGGVLDGSGEQTLRVGATHAAIPVGQDSGSYSGTFTVEVAY